MANDLQDLRRSAVVSGFGPGAVVDFRAHNAPVSSMAAGLEEWDRSFLPAGLANAQTVRETRLQKKLGVQGLGARAIAELLHAQGHRFHGASFNNSNVAGILAQDHCRGFYYDARSDEHGNPLPQEQWAKVACPAIVTEEQFAAVAARRALRNPRKTPPRATSSVTMLPGTLARCGQLDCRTAEPA